MIFSAVSLEYINSCCRILITLELSTPKHLLWALLLLKRYSIESVNAALARVSEKTFRKWSHTFIWLLSNIPMVNKSEIIILKTLNSISVDFS